MCVSGGEDRIVNPFFQAAFLSEKLKKEGLERAISIGGAALLACVHSHR